MKTPTFLSALALLALAAGCGRQETGHDHAARAGHAHTAPHGGTLVEVGAHAFNLEFVRDPSGKLSAYVLDGHAENFVRLKAPSFDLVLTAPEARTVTFRAVANPATGETIGDTSQFDAADAPKAGTPLQGKVPSLEIRGATFRDLAVRLP